MRSAEQAGAVAVVVYDNADGPLLPMAKRDDQQDVDIPAVFVSLSAGRLLKTMITSGGAQGCRGAGLYGFRV